jgi:hypothetical protein
VVVDITSSSAACVVTPVSLTFSTTNYETPQSVTVAANQDDVDQGDSAVFAVCDVKHIVTSTDTAYATSGTVDVILKLSITDDDTADTKLRPSGDSASQFAVKFLGPLSITEGAGEGTEVSFGVQLDSLPTQDVNVNVAITKLPSSTTLTTIVASPTTLLFKPSDWTSTQQQAITVTVANDDIDSNLDSEDFTLTLSIDTQDIVYKAKATDMTVIVSAIDDDTAGITACAKVGTTCESVMNLVEGAATGTTFEITSLNSKPLHDVTLTIDVGGPPLSNLVTVVPSTIVVPVNKWNNINKVVTVKAAIGQYGALSSFVMGITASSQDDKYNTIKSSTMKFEQPTAVTITSTQAGLVGVPADQQRWTEGGLFVYKVRLNVKPESGVKAVVQVLSSETRCNILTGIELTFTENNWNKEQEIKIEASDDGLYLAKDAVSYTCIVRHVFFINFC